MEVYIIEIAQKNANEKLIDDVNRLLPLEMAIQKGKNLQKSYASAVAKWHLFQLAKNIDNNRKDMMDWEVSKDGKPSLKNNNWHFSLSHSSELVALSISPFITGVDIQEHRSFKENVLKRVLSKNELFYYESDPSPERFFELWTQKEAVVKCEGTGIKLGLTEIDVLQENNAFENHIITSKNIPYSGAYSLAIASVKTFDLPQIKKITHEV